jgi:hypothetical protein
VSKWQAADLPRRVCLVLGMTLTAFGVAQFAAMAVLSVLAATWANGAAAHGLPGAPPGGEPPFAFLMRLGLAWQVLLVAPIVMGVGGIFVFNLTRPLAGQLVVALGAVSSAPAARSSRSLPTPESLKRRRAVRAPPLPIPGG